jgi:multisubunit Na+/H+ antiporter MnhE subunit
MLHAAALLCGFSILWMLLTRQWDSAQAWMIAIAAGGACAIFALRFGGVSRAFARAPQLSVLSLARIGAVFRGAVATMRAAISADVTLKPALVRVKTRAERNDHRTSFATLLNATPGMIVVDTDADGFLVHVIDEDDVDTDDLGRLEQSIVGGRR